MVRIGEKTQGTTARYLDISAASAYTSLSERALYHRVSRREIPFIKQGRRILFDRVALDRWMRRVAVDAVTPIVVDSAGQEEPRHDCGR